MTPLITVATAIGGVTVLGFLLRLYFPWLKYDYQAIKAFGRILILFKGYTRRQQFVVDMFEAQVKKQPKKTFIVFQDKDYTYEFVDKKMNQIARAGLEIGLKKGDVVAVLMENGPAFIWTFYGENYVWK